MQEGFEHLRCPMCGGELIYSEGTHDLCCVRNTYESAAACAVREGGALHEERAGYGGGEREDAYKAWGEGGRLRQSAGGSVSVDMRYPLTQTHSGSGGMEQDVDADRSLCSESDRMLTCSHPFHAGERGKENETVEHQTGGEHSHTVTGDSPVPDAPVKPRAGESVVCVADAGEVSAGEENKAIHSAAPVKGHGSERAPADRGRLQHSHAGTDNSQSSDTPVKGHGCVFAVSFTESARLGTLWSVRLVHRDTNYFALMRLMQKIEKRRASGEPLAANAPFQLKKRERSPAARLAFRFGIEEEDVYSIKFSSETVKRLAVFYGITEREVRMIRETELGENNSDSRFDE